MSQSDDNKPTSEFVFMEPTSENPPAPPRRRSRSRRVIRGTGDSSTTVISSAVPETTTRDVQSASQQPEQVAAEVTEENTVSELFRKGTETAEQGEDSDSAANSVASQTESASEPPVPAEKAVKPRAHKNTTRKRTTKKADAARSARIKALADEFFTDPGLSVSDLPPAQSSHATDEEDEKAARADSRTTVNDRHSADTSDASSPTGVAQADSAQPATKEPPVRRRVRRHGPVDVRPGSRDDEQSSIGAGIDATVPSADADLDERARRARNAASQILEFSNSEPPASSPRPVASNAMTSLLFQEPGTARTPRWAEESTTPEEGTRRRRTRSTRRAVSNGVVKPAPAMFSDDDGDRPRSHRRLNAQERRAAAEVEQIESDLAHDDIHYRPVENDERRDDREENRDEDGESATRIRRRTRRVRQDNQTDTLRETEEKPRARRDDDEETLTRRRRMKRAEEPARDNRDDDDDILTRRRRRRRNGKADDEEIIPRSRKQQYIDEITDIEGSTRLEAKKQRRRDNRRDRSRQNLITEQDFLARREVVQRLMVVREKERHTQISVIEDNTLVEHYVSDIQDVSSVGNIYLGRVQNVLPSMEAAFVDIGQARNGVLYAGEVNWDTTRLEGQPRRIELAFKSGDPVLVQVTKDPIGHKGARLTSQVTLAGRFLVLVPSGGMTGVSRKLPASERTRLKNIVAKIAPKDMGVIIRTAAEGADQESIEKDLEHLQKQWESITAKQEEFQHSRRPHLLQGEPDVAIRVVRDIFNDDFSKLIVQGDNVYERIEQYLSSTAPDLLERVEKWDPEEHAGKDVFDKWSIDSQLRKGMERKVYLPSGGSLVIDRTEAMTTIDVNTGRFIGKGKSLEETVTRCNLEAAEEIVRQLRLRDIGGMIMIDFVDMVLPQNRDLVLRRLVECLSRDRTKHQVAEVTSLGLVQMTRKRVGQGLVEAFSEECPTCKGRGFILHDKPVVSASYDDPYALKGGDPFVRTNKHNRGTQAPERELSGGSTSAVKAKLAQIAAAAQAQAADEERENREEDENSGNH